MLEDLQPPKQVRICKVGRILLELDSKDRDILNAALVNPEWNMSQLAQALKPKGISVVPDTLRSHQKGLCAC